MTRPGSLEAPRRPWHRPPARAGRAGPACLLFLGLATGCQRTWIDVALAGPADASEPADAAEAGDAPVEGGGGGRAGTPPAADASPFEPPCPLVEPCSPGLPAVGTRERNVP